jgi:CSLREA domain-containing protein
MALLFLRYLEQSFKKKLTCLTTIYSDLFQDQAFSQKTQSHTIFTARKGIVMLIRQHINFVRVLLVVIFLTGVLFSIGDGVLGAPTVTLTVNLTTDDSDANPGDGICDVNLIIRDSQCTLRGAIEEANSLSSATTIIFDPSITEIFVTRRLPPLNNPGNYGITIDGQRRYLIDPYIVISGENLTRVENGLVLQTGNHRIHRLLITGFMGSGILITGDNNLVGTNGDGVNDLDERNILVNNTDGDYLSYSDSGIKIDGDSNIVAGNHIGFVSNTGIYQDAANGYAGIFLNGGATDNRIGTDGNGISDSLERNIISGSHVVGVEIMPDADHNTIAGNYFGLSPDGTSAIGSTRNGISINGNGNIIGTNGNGQGDTAERNIIAGSFSYGLLLLGEENIVSGNYIGTDVSGVTAIGNGGGVLLGGVANILGTDGDGQADVLEGNLISGNDFSGVEVYGSGTEQAVIAGNKIGLDASGTLALPNTGEGILVSNGVDVRIGTKVSLVPDNFEGNVISGNYLSGISVKGASIQGLNISGNTIGMNLNRSAAIPNGEYGIYVNEAQITTIGVNGSVSGDSIQRNFISGNTYSGVMVENAPGTVVAGNYIGVNGAGNAAIPNGDGGVIVISDDVIVGTDGDGNNDHLEGNLISGNVGDGIVITGSYDGENPSERNRVAGNMIGSDGSGTVAIPNTWCGVSLFTDAEGNTIGTNGDGSGDAAEANLIVGNTLHGVCVRNGGNFIAGNWIGYNPENNQIIPNTRSGVRVETSGSTRIGSNGDGISDELEGNIISGNLYSGIEFADHTSGPSYVYGNQIGTNGEANLRIPNGRNGVSVYSSSDVFIGGNLPAQANIISANQINGILLENTTQISLQGNYIGTNPLGENLGNLSAGILVLDSSGNTIGGTDEGAGNWIAYNDNEGILIWAESNPAVQNSIRRNRIFNNDHIGIDLGNDGVTENDAGDIDSAENELLNFPSVNHALTNGNQIWITGELHSTPLTRFSVELFASQVCHVVGHGEGENYLGAVTVITNVNGAADFIFVSPQFIAPGSIITSTTTDESGNTSEFSACQSTVSSEFSARYLPMIKGR